MRNLLLVMGILLAGCATTSGNDAKPIASISSKTLAAGECGLYVWTADAYKTFILFATPQEISYSQKDKTIALTEVNPKQPPLASREFKDPEGKDLSLTLLSPEEFDGGIRYKAGRLTSLSDEGWEKVVPVVGLYACQPIA
jgi:hypothetical protein